MCRRGKAIYNKKSRAVADCLSVTARLVVSIFCFFVVCARGRPSFLHFLSEF
ncbi:predicted protein [Enterococcus faecalis Merz96]|nr:predicted protein [Enterococcus faecalis Merz96]